MMIKSQAAKGESRASPEGEHKTLLRGLQVDRAECDVREDAFLSRCAILIDDLDALAFCGRREALKSTGGEVLSIVDHQRKLTSEESNWLAIHLRSRAKILDLLVCGFVSHENVYVVALSSDLTNDVQRLSVYLLRGCCGLHIEHLGRCLEELIVHSGSFTEKSF
jgi:hypothetical protein